MAFWIGLVIGAFCGVVVGVVFLCVFKAGGKADQAWYESRQ